MEISTSTKQARIYATGRPGVWSAAMAGTLTADGRRILYLRDGYSGDGHTPFTYYHQFWKFDVDRNYWTDIHEWIVGESISGIVSNFYSAADGKYIVFAETNGQSRRQYELDFQTREWTQVEQPEAVFHWSTSVLSGRMIIGYSHDNRWMKYDLDTRQFQFFPIGSWPIPPSLGRHPRISQQAVLSEESPNKLYLLWENMARGTPDPELEFLEQDLSTMQWKRLMVPPVVPVVSSNLVSVTGGFLLFATTGRSISISKSWMLQPVPTPRERVFKYTIANDFWEEVTHLQRGTIPGRQEFGYRFALHSVDGSTVVRYGGRIWGSGKYTLLASRRSRCCCAKARTIIGSLMSVDCDARGERLTKAALWCCRVHSQERPSSSGCFNHDLDGIVWKLPSIWEQAANATQRDTSHCDSKTRRISGRGHILPV